MPKTLYLVRHAKSSWNHQGLSDRQRPLNKRGKRDAPFMAKRLAQKSLAPQYIFSSPAVRALGTAKAFAAEMELEDSQLVVVEEIYGAGSDELISMIKQIDDAIDCVLMVGHNPDMTWLVNRLTGADIENVPTCGVAVLGIYSESWKDVDTEQTELVDFDYPKKDIDE